MATIDFYRSIESGDNSVISLTIDQAIETIQTQGSLCEKYENKKIYRFWLDIDCKEESFSPIERDENGELLNQEGWYENRIKSYVIAINRLVGKPPGRPAVRESCRTITQENGKYINKLSFHVILDWAFTHESRLTKAFIKAIHKAVVRNRPLETSEEGKHEIDIAVYSNKGKLRTINQSKKDQPDSRSRMLKCRGTSNDIAHQFFSNVEGLTPIDLRQFVEKSRSESRRVPVQQTRSNQIQIPTTIVTPKTKKFVKHVLGFVSEEEDFTYDQWIANLIALKTSFGDEILDVAIWWSEQSLDHDTDRAVEGVISKWESFKEDHDKPRTFASIKMKARERGWNPINEEFGTMTWSHLSNKWNGICVSDPSVFDMFMDDCHKTVVFVNDGNDEWRFCYDEATMKNGEQTLTKKIKWVKSSSLEKLAGAKIIIDEDGKEKKIPIGRFVCDLAQYLSVSAEAYLPYTEKPKEPTKILNMYRLPSYLKADEKECPTLIKHFDAFEHKDYVLSHLNSTINRPYEKPGVALIVTGKHGCGKSAIFEVLLRNYFDTNHAMVTNIHDLTNKYNRSTFENTCVITVSEAQSFENQKHDLSVLKDLITNSSIQTEEKFASRRELRSHHSFYLTSNDDHPLMVQATERRFAILKMNDTYLGNREHFKALFEELNDDGCLKAFANYLKQFNIPLYEIPQSESLENSRMIDPLTAKFESILEGREEIPHKGVIDKENNKIILIKTSDLYRSFGKWQRTTFDTKLSAIVKSRGFKIYKRLRKDHLISELPRGYSHECLVIPSSAWYDEDEEEELCSWNC